MTKTTMSTTPFTNQADLIASLMSTKEVPIRGDNSVEKKGFLVRLPVTTHARLNWVVDHTPRSSIQKIILDGIEAEVERRIAAIQANEGRAIR
jgi:hypothetical protein